VELKYTKGPSSLLFVFFLSFSEQEKKGKKAIQGNGDLMGSTSNIIISLK